MPVALHVNRRRTGASSNPAPSRMTVIGSGVWMVTRALPSVPVMLSKLSS